MRTDPLYKRILLKSWNCLPEKSQYILGDPVSSLFYGFGFRRTPLYKKTKKLWVDSLKWDSEQLKQYQWQRLKKLLDHAYTYSPYYNQLFRKAGIHPDDITCYEDLTRIPITTKQDLRIHKDHIYSRDPNFRKYLFTETSGSTGTPVSFHYDFLSVIARNIIVERWTESTGYRRKDRKVIIRRKHFQNDEQAHRFHGQHYPNDNTLFFSSTNMKPEILEIYAHKLYTFRPAIIEGYSSAIYTLASFMAEKGMKYECKGIIASTDTMFPSYREVIKEVFGTEPYLFYGQVEEVCTGSECSYHDGLHINMESHLVEVLDDNDCQIFSARGDIVGTNLDNYLFPLIRYRTGDMAILTKDPCKCGRHHFRLLDLDGRKDDMLILPDGRKMSTGSLWLCAEGIRNIKRYQLVQKHSDRIVVNIEPGMHFTVHDQTRLIQQLRQHTGDRIIFEVRLVERISLVKGKFRFILNELDSKQ